MVFFPIVTQLLVGLGFFSSSWGGETLCRLRMEDLTHRCDNLPLSTWEGKKVMLSRKKQVLDCVLVVKFFMKRALNIEAVARTFRPPWCTKEKLPYY